MSKYDKTNKKLLSKLTESSVKRRSRRSETKVREGREGSIPCPECGTMTYTDQTCSDRHCEKHHEYVGE